MDLSTFELLLSPSGRESLDAAAGLDPVEDRFLSDFRRLCRSYPRDLARAALETAILRRVARAKFGEDARVMYFTREALEQATSGEVAAYRARRFEPFAVVADLGCSVGGDTFALARRSPRPPLSRTVGIELDPLRLAMARANTAALGLERAVSFVRADVAAGLPLQPRPDAALFFDPSRRAGGRRQFRVSGYHPPLSVVDGWRDDFPATGVKISPAVRWTELAGYDAELEFISLGGELKDAVLWFGPLAGAVRRATVLPGRESLAGTPDESGGRVTRPPRVSEPKSFLYEPDPAVIRAGLVRLLAEDLDACQLDPDIAFLTAERAVDTPFARSWPVEEWMPFGLKRLRARLRERDVGRVTVHKRGSPIEPSALIRELRLRGDRRQRIVLTHLSGRPIVVFCGPEL